MILDEFLYNLKNNKETVCYSVNDINYTYSQMYQYICNLYEYILENNKEKKPVIVYGSKEIYMKASFLACSFAGVTYVPVDKIMPEDRVNSIIEQIEPALILGDFENKEVTNLSSKNIFDIMNNKDYKDIDKIQLQKDDIYYIIFTSGSIGIPKGVKVTYENVDSCINWLREELQIKNEKILNQASFSFDLSVADLYLSLLEKSSQYIVEKDTQNDFGKLFESLKKSDATLAVMTPSFADYLLLEKSFNKELLPNLKKIIFCGEKLLNPTVKKLYSRFEDIDIINSYGPTECTFAVTSIYVTKDMLEDEISVGIPKNDVEIHIVDENLKQLKENEVGEILISGKSVANGYVSKIENNPFIEYEGKKSYLTGDVGYIKNNELYYICRKDKQVKFKGYRIELSDIEKNLYNLNYIEKAVVSTKTKDDGKVMRICAFVKIKENSDIDSNNIRNDLLKSVPEYMCPQIKIVSKFPLTKNGKCDEKRLIEEY